MFEDITMAEARDFFVGRDHLPEKAVVATIGDNNTELKILAQKFLRVNEPVPVTQVMSDLIVACGDVEVHPVGSGTVHRALDGMNEEFVRVGKSPKGRKTATQTKIGLFISAATGGHLLSLSEESGVPLRHLIGEASQHQDEELMVTTGSIETRLSILATMFGLAREEWQKASDLLDAFDDKGIAQRVARSHLTDLASLGIVERDDQEGWENGVKTGYRYRIKQEGGAMTPVTLVERYLSIVALSSLADPSFVEEGLIHLGEISSDPESVVELLTKSRASYGAVRNSDWQQQEVA